MFSDFSFSSESNGSSFSDSVSTNSSKSSFENNVNSSSTPFTNENRLRNRTSSRNETRNRNISLFSGINSQSSESHSRAITSSSLRNRNASRTEFSNRHRIRTAVSFSNNEDNHSSNFSFNDLPSPITFESESLSNYRNRNSSRNESINGHGMSFVVDGTDQTDPGHLVSQLTSDFLAHSDYSSIHDSEFESISSSYQSDNSSIYLALGRDVNNNQIDFDVDNNNNINIFDDSNSSIDSSPGFYTLHAVSSVHSAQDRFISPQYDIGVLFEHLQSDIIINHYQSNSNNSQDFSDSYHALPSNDNDAHQSSSAPRMTMFESNDLSNDDFFQ